MANRCDVYLLKSKTLSDNTVVKFPIVDYSNVFYDENHSSIQATIAKFMEYCTLTDNVDYFQAISSIDFTKGYFKINKTYAASNEYNYCLIQDLHDQKWYCCFINSVTWDANLVTATFNFEIDVFHTYIKAVKLKKCFIERQHVTNDTFGLHVLDEGIGVSEYIATNTSDFNRISYIPVVAIADTSLLHKGTSRTGFVPDAIVNVNSYEKTICLVAPNYDTVIDPMSVRGMEAFTQFIDMMYLKNKGDSIVCSFYMPSSFLSSHFEVCCYDPNKPDAGTDEPWQALYCTKNVVTSITESQTSIQRPGRTLSYGSRQIVLNNNKSLTYPFVFGEITNNNGGKIQLKFELSSNTSAVTCNYYNSPVHAGKPYLYASNYDGIAINTNRSLTGLENPDLPYIHNSYGAYISSQRNALTNSMEYIKSDKDLALFNNEVDTVQTQTGQFVNYFGNAAIGNVGGALKSGMDITNSEIDYRQSKNNIQYSANKSMDAINAKLRDAKTKGNTASGVACCNSLLNIGKHCFTKCVYIPQYEEMLTIDNYFSKFGYKINDYQVPNLNTRPLFNYVKCSEVNLTGNIPSEYLDVMKAIFSAGVTLWHDLDRMYDFDFVHNLAATR